jgi:predicted DNA-binding protein
MSREKILRVRLSDEEWERLEYYAKAKSHSLSEVIRDYIKKLPKGGS